MAAILKATQNMFKKHPLVSNMVVYGSLYVGAEFSQQMLTRKWQDTEPVQDIDRKALGRYAIMGTFILSPGLYAWYKWLDGKFVGTTKRIIFRKLMLDQFLMTPPLLATFFIGMSIMEGKEDIFQETREKYIPTFARSCLFWLPAQSVNFLLVPSRYRVVYIASCSFFWINILCWVKRQKLMGSSQIQQQGATEEDQ